MISGETAVISAITDNQLAVKLLEMGFLPGVVVHYRFAAPLGDPICLSVMDFDLALRRDEADNIQIFN